MSAIDFWIVVVNAIKEHSSITDVLTREVVVPLAQDPSTPEDMNPLLMGRLMMLCRAAPDGVLRELLAVALFEMYINYGLAARADKVVRELQASIHEPRSN